MLLSHVIPEEFLVDWLVACSAHVEPWTSHFVLPLVYGRKTTMTLARGAYDNTVRTFASNVPFQTILIAFIDASVVDVDTVVIRLCFKRHEQEILFVGEFGTDGMRIACSVACEAFDCG
jgi:hypothetical protein